MAHEDVQPGPKDIFEDPDADNGGNGKDVPQIPEDIAEDPENGGNRNGNSNDHDGRQNQPTSLFFFSMIVVAWARYENVDEILHG